MKVSQSYWPGLFACYVYPELPRTNNDLEHLFGSHRYHERRASGRKVASPGLVVSGAVRVLAGLATRLCPDEGLRLPAGYVERWRERRLRSWKSVGRPGGSRDASAVIRQPTFINWRKLLPS